MYRSSKCLVVVALELPAREEINSWLNIRLVTTQLMVGCTQSRTAGGSLVFRTCGKTKLSSSSKITVDIRKQLREDEEGEQPGQSNAKPLDGNY